jgi:two-component system response regulator NreC
MIRAHRPGPSAVSAVHQQGGHTIVTTPPFHGEHLRTVVVCDDRPELREAIGSVLAEVPRFRVIGEATDGTSCLQQVLDLKPDVLILDASIPGGGTATARTAKALLPHLHIVVFSGRPDRRLQREMLAAGADQYVVKTGRLRPLIEALDRSVTPAAHRT